MPNTASFYPVYIMNVMLNLSTIFVMSVVTSVIFLFRLFVFQGDQGPAGPRGFPGPKGDRVSIKTLLILHTT